eukprot:SAG22_NODE_100_length_20558_cov_10.189305_5_plen_188_part_00
MPPKYTAIGTVDLDQLDDEEAKFPPPDWGARLPKTSMCARLFFAWMTPLIKLGKERQINLDDLPPGLEAGKLHYQNLEIAPLVAQFNQFRALRPNAPLFRPLLEVFWLNIIVAWFLAVSEQACNLGNPALLRMFLASFNEDAVDGQRSGFNLAVSMLLLSVFQTFVGNHGFLIISTLGVKQRAVGAL